MNDNEDRADDLFYSVLGGFTEDIYEAIYAARAVDKYRLEEHAALFND